MAYMIAATRSEAGTPAAAHSYLPWQAGRRNLLTQE